MEVLVIDPKTIKQIETLHRALAGDKPAREAFIVPTYKTKTIDRSLASPLHQQLAREVAELGPSEPKDCPKLQRVDGGRFVEVG